jgi:O-antigen/teichoic acid export membrane protein
VTSLLARVRRREQRGAGREKHGYKLLVKDSVIYGGGRSLIKLLHALLLPLYTAFLTPSDYGLLGLVLTTATLIDVFVTLGFDVAFTRFYFDDDTDANRRKVITTVFYVKVLYGGLLLGALALVMPQIAELVTGDPDDAIYFNVALINIFFTNWHDLPFTLFRLDHRPWTFTAFTVGRIFVQIPVTVALVVWADMGPMGVLIGNAASAAVMNFLSLPTYWKRVSWRLDRHHMWAMMDFAAPAIFTTLSFYLLKLSDRYFFVNYRSRSELGLYTVAQSLAQPVYLVMMAFRMAWPQWHYAKLKDPVLHKRLVARSSTYFLLFCLFMVTIMGVFMPLIVRLLTSKPAYWGVGPTTLVLAFSTVAYSAYFVFWVGSNVAKKNRLIPVIAAIAGGVNIALNFWAVPEYGMFGAACTTFIGYALLAFMVYFISNHYYPIRFEWARLSKLVLATAVALGAALGISLLIGAGAQQPFTDMLWKQAVVAPTVLLFPLTLWLARFFTPGEREKLVARLRHPFRRGKRPPKKAPAGASVVTAAGAAVAVAGAAGIGGGVEGAQAGDAAAAGGGAADQAGSTSVPADDAEEEAEEREEEEMEAETEIDLDTSGGIV